MLLLVVSLLALLAVLRLSPRYNSRTPAGVWRQTKAALPCGPYKQVDVLMWSPEWSTYVHGLFTNYGDSVEWLCYDANQDKFYDWSSVPEWYTIINPPA